MGRSVSTPTDAVEVLYLDWMPDPDDLDEMVTESLEINDRANLCRHDRQAWADDMVSDEFDYLIEDFRDNVLRDLFPSVIPADTWVGREDHVIAENDLAEFGVSEYGGLAALWVIPRREASTFDRDITGMALHWISQAWPKVEAMYPNRLTLMGRFSNGEAVYRRVEATR